MGSEEIGQLLPQFFPSAREVFSSRLCLPEGIVLPISQDRPRSAPRMKLLILTAVLFAGGHGETDLGEGTVNIQDQGSPEARSTNFFPFPTEEQGNPRKLDDCPFNNNI